MKDITKHYTRDGLTIVWKPDQCIHSKICWTTLSTVFNPRLRPWINMDGAALDEIRDQVAACPSGALSYMMEEEKVAGDATQNSNTVVEIMKNGPLMVYGNIRLKDQQGTTSEQHKVTAFCRCGASGNKPFCDGSHVRVGFKDGTNGGEEQ